MVYKATFGLLRSGKVRWGQLALAQWNNEIPLDPSDVVIGKLYYCLEIHLGASITVL